MKKLLIFLLILLMLTSCAPQADPPPDTGEAQNPVTDTSEDDTTAEKPSAEAPPAEESPIEEPPAEESPVEEPPAEEPPIEDTPAEDPPSPAHSPLYMEGVSVEDVIVWFNEVCLDAEVGTGDQAHLVQKWMEPIIYRVSGSPTDTDIQTLESFTFQFNLINGFPGMREMDEDGFYNLDIHFCTGDELVEIMGSQFSAYDYGAVLFWFDSDNYIYQSTICCRSDIDQSERCSVIAEELYNGLGPVQDTLLRQDSLIYQYANEAQRMTEIDRLILKLLYHPSIRPGMTAAECEAVIRELYY